MDIYVDAIRDLSPADKLQLVERIWRDLTATDSELPISPEVLAEMKRRRDELVADPEAGRTHADVWDRIGKWRDG